MKNIIFQNISTWLYNFSIKIQDWISPFSSWVAVILFHGYWVSKSAKKEVRVGGASDRRHEKIRDYLYSLHQPKNWIQAVISAFVIIFLPQVLTFFWFISSFFPHATSYGWDDMGSVSILGSTWQVTSGLIGITFIIVIFVVEYANRDKYERRAFPVFLAETQLLFTASFGLFVILSMGLTSFILSLIKIRSDYLSFLFYWQWFLFGINILLILKIFISTVQILPRSSFASKVKKYNHFLTSRLVELDLIDKVAINIADQSIKNMGVNFPFFKPDLRPEMANVSFPNLPRQIQKVTDINIKLVEIAYRHAKQLLPNIKETDFIFFAKLDHRIAQDKPWIAMINPIINLPSVTSYLKRCIKINAISRSEKSRLIDELVLVRDVILLAVQNHEIKTVEDLLEHYIDLIEAFLKATDSYGIHFNQESASKQMNLFSDWKLVSTIIDQYQSLIPPFLSSNDFEMVKEFLRLPVEMMDLAVLYKDHLIYQQFGRLYSQIYFCSRDIQDERQRNTVVEFLLHLLIDHRRFTLIPDINKIFYDEQQLIDYKEYCEDLLVIWNRLLKQALDYRSSRRFGEFTKEINRIIHDFFPKVDETQIQLLEFHQQNKAGEDQQSYVSKQIQFNKLVVRYKLELGKLRQRMFLGFGGWLIHLLETTQISQDDYFNFIPIVNQFFLDIQNLYQDYVINYVDRRGDSPFEWTWWEMSERAPEYGEVSASFIEFNSLLEKYFLIRSVEIIPFQDYPLPSLPPCSHSGFIYQSIERKCRGILNENLWLEILKRACIDNLDERILAFIKILQEANIKLTVLEEEKIKQAPLDTELVESFRIEVMRNWKKSARIRQLAIKFGRYRETFNEEISNPLFNNLILFPKEGFIKQDQEVYFGGTDAYGYELAKYEDSFLGSQFCVGTPISITAEVQNEEISRQLNEMVELGRHPLIFINGKEVSKNLYKYEHFIHPWHVQSNFFKELPLLGIYDDCPIIPNDGLPLNTIYIVDICQFGILTKYELKEDNPDSIPIYITLLSPGQVDEIIKENWEFTKNPNTHELQEREISERRVLQNVRLQITEFCQFEEINPDAVRSLVLVSENS